MDAKLAAIIAEMDERSRRLERWCRAARARFDRTRIAVVDAGRWRYALHRSSRPGVAFQLSRWYDGEPIGHTDFSAWRDAVRELFRERGRAARANA